MFCLFSLIASRAVLLWFRVALAELHLTGANTVIVQLSAKFALYLCAHGSGQCAGELCEHVCLAVRDLGDNRDLSMRGLDAGGYVSTDPLHLEPLPRRFRGIDHRAV
jgi:hypothetical protein